MARFWPAATLAVLGAAALQASAPQPALMEFGDWTVACDNGGECTALSLSRAYVRRVSATDPGDYATPKLWVKRRAGPDALPRVFVDTSIWGEAGDIDALTLHVYRDCSLDCTGRAYALQRLEPGRFELAAEQVAAFMAESRTSDRAATRRSDGSMHGIISTAGLTAALRWIDTRQGRAGTVTAIYAKGPAPARIVPPEPERISVSVVRSEPQSEHVPEMRPAALRLWREHCPGMDEVAGADRLGYMLRDGHKLWSLSCSANQHYPVRLWLVETAGGGIAAHLFPRPDRGGQPDTPALPHSAFDPGSGQITSYSGGMCGWQRRWAWTGQGFAMIDSIEMPACFGIVPHQWLQTYRAVPE